MKKLLRSLLAVMLIVVTVTAFTACKKDKKKSESQISPSKVEDKLKDLDYEVGLIDDEVVLDEYAEALDVDGITAIIEAWSEDDYSYVTIIWLEKKADAEDALDTIEEIADYEVASNGKIVVAGEGDAFDDACDIVKAK